MSIEKKYGTTAAAWAFYDGRFGIFEPSLYCLLRHIDIRNVADALRDTIVYAVKVEKDDYAKRLVGIFMRAVSDREHADVLVPVENEPGVYKLKAVEGAPDIVSTPAVLTELISLYRLLPVRKVRTHAQPNKPEALETKMEILTEAFRIAEGSIVSPGRDAVIDFLIEWHAAKGRELLEEETKMWGAVLRDVLKRLRLESLEALALRMADSERPSAFRDTIMSMTLVERVKKADPKDLPAMVRKSFGN